MLRRGHIRSPPTSSTYIFRLDRCFCAAFAPTPVSTSGDWLEEVARPIALPFGRVTLCITLPPPKKTCCYRTLRLIPLRQNCSVVVKTVLLSLMYRRLRHLTARWSPLPASTRRGTCSPSRGGLARRDTQTEAERRLCSATHRL